MVVLKLCVCVGGGGEGGCGTGKVLDIRCGDGGRGSERRSVLGRGRKSSIQPAGLALLGASGLAQGSWTALWWLPSRHASMKEVRGGCLCQ